MRKFIIILSILTITSCMQNSQNKSTIININTISNVNSLESNSNQNTKIIKKIIPDTINKKLKDTIEINNVTLPIFSSSFFYWKNGYDELVKVKFFNLVQNYVNDQQLKIIVPRVMIRTKYKCENELSYIPTELALIDAFDKNGILAQVTYKSKNKFNVELLYTEVYRINKNLEIDELYKNYNSDNQ